MEREHLDTTARDTIGVIQQEIEDAHSRMGLWHERAERCVSMYRGEGDAKNPDSDKFKILWMITEIQRPMLYSGGAKADVRRKHLDRDPVARLASQILERSTQCSMDDDLHEFDFAVDSAVSDYAIAGRGQTRVVYDAEFEPKKRYLAPDEARAVEEQAPDIEVLTDDTGPYVEDGEEKVSEDAWIEHVHWGDFLHSDGQKWEDVWWVAFGSWLTKEDLAEQFGRDVAEEVPMAGTINSDKERGDYLGYEKGRDDFARVWEFWSKRTGKVYKIAQYYNEFLEPPIDDPYGLKGFFPCPRPLDMICTTGSLEPIPEHKMYEDQAVEANRLTGRIDRLIEAVRFSGIYDSAMGEAVSKLFEGDDNELIPAENFAATAAKGGIEGSVMFAPAERAADTIVKLSAQRQQNLEIIYQVVGLSDIMRGVTNPREAYKTQELKAQMAAGSTSRMRRKQVRVERFVRDSIRILAEVVGELFDPETLIAKANLEVGDKQALQGAVQLLKSDTPRGYRIDVESDTTVAPDDETRKRDFTEFIGALSGLISQGMQAAQTGMMPPELMSGIVLFGLRKFKAGRDVEESIEQAFQKMQQAQQEKGPSPEEQAAQQKMQIEQGKLQLKQQELQLKAQKQMQDLQIEIMELMQRGEIEQAKILQAKHSDMINLYTVMINSGMRGRPSEK